MSRDMGPTISILRPRTATDRLVLALDTASLERAESLSRLLYGRIGMVKVGLELFSAQGPRSVSAFRDMGLPVFLDLKLHDIPSTVMAAASQAARMGVSFLTVHASGSTAMIEAAVQGAIDGAASSNVEPPSILAVTVLTSMDEGSVHEVGLMGSPEAVVRRLARLAVAAGASGLVCSVKESAVVREEVGSAPLIFTPGIRFSEASDDDQARIATPADAVAAGADYLVIGRPIRNAPDPLASVDAIVRSLSSPEP